MDKAEIDRRISAVHSRANERRMAIETCRRLSKEVTKTLRKAMWNLDYDILPGRKISVAYRWDNNGNVLMHFAIRSDKDHFSRAEARRALLTHIEEGTHVLKFDVKKPSKTSRVRWTDRDVLSFPATAALAERMLTHSNEFPKRLVKDFIKFDRIVRLIYRADELYTDAAVKMVDFLER
jgi:hypothetical protein